MKQNNPFDTLHLIAATQANLFGSPNKDSLIYAKYALAQQNKNNTDIINNFMIALLMFSMVFGSGCNANLIENVKETKDNTSFAQPDNFNQKSEDSDVVVPVAGVLSKYYDINNENFIKKFVDENWFDIIVALIEFETWEPKPRIIGKSTDRYTYSLGLTWFYQKNNSGKYIQHPCLGEYLTLAKNVIGTAEEWNQIRQHLYYKNECIHKIQKAIKALSSQLDYISNKDLRLQRLSAQKLIALLIIGYQRPNDATKIIKKLAVAQNGQEIADAFLHYNGDKDHESGSMKRCWMAAMYYMGAITTDNILKMRVDDFGSLNSDKILTKTLDDNGNIVTYNAIITPEAIKYAINLVTTNTFRNKPTVTQFMRNNVHLKKLYNKKVAENAAKITQQKTKQQQFK